MMKRIVVFILTLTMIFSVSSVSFAADSYTEYFSEEREFVVNDDTYNWSTYFYSDEETGYLYSRNVDTEEIRLIYSQNVTEHYLYGDKLYCVVDGKSIVKITVTGQNPQTILTTTKDINQFYVNDDLIFYLMDNAIYRYHIDSETTDCIVQDDYIYFFYPYTNFVVEWGDGNENVYRLDLRARSSIPVSVDMYTFLINTAGVSETINYSIHGTTIPYDPYDHEKYFNTSIDDPCPCHPYSSYCANPATCGSCKYVNSGYQCSAFAHTVHKEIWGTYGSRTDQYLDIHTAALAREVFWDIPSGTNVRVALRGSYTNDNLPIDSTIAQDSFKKHSFIVANVSETGITVYEANWPYACIIKYIRLSYSELAERYIDLCWSFGTQHSFRSIYVYNESIHWHPCSTINCNGKSNINYHNLVTNSQGILVCSTCGYNSGVSQNSLSEELISLN